MKSSASIAALSKALVAVQADLKAIQKDSINPHFRNSYASLDNIIEEVRPALARQGIAVVQGAVAPESVDGHLSSFAVETTLIHESGEWLSTSAVIPLAKADPQGAGGAMTYGRRYGLAAALCLATDEDDDGNAASAHPGAPERIAKPAATRTASQPRSVREDQEYHAGLRDRPSPPKPVVQPKAAECPKCSGAMWDNRTTKKNPRQPDFKCKDKQCDGVIWPPKDKPAVGQREYSEDDDERVAAMRGAAEEDDRLPF